MCRRRFLYLILCGVLIAGFVALLVPQREPVLVRRPLEETVAQLETEPVPYALRLARLYFPRYGGDAVWQWLQHADGHSVAANVLAIAAVEQGDKRFVPKLEALAASNSGINSLAAEVLREYRVRFSTTSQPIEGDRAK